MTTSNRKLIRPDAPDTKRDSTVRAVRRKQTPPEQTNAEEFYYLKQMANKTPMVVMLNNDEELLGWIEWYDKGALKLNRLKGPNLLIRKDSIRYMYKEEELPRDERTAKKRAARAKAAPGKADATATARADGSADGPQVAEKAPAKRKTLATATKSTAKKSTAKGKRAAKNAEQADG